ncbi:MULTISPECIES: Hsp20/alpha crystallin family protein [Staphylococcus]|uniref:Hsp20/alpha crystallin family protein n=1 Tax=Staphylococcus TaxID=1279 RepID=UPI00069E366F|nr:MULTISPECIES: Hsp20/alpha crystallin family protein [Staphylococcus]MCE4958432.1 Hsp20/alpha crystallin family protein [Staphylococcus haemolyticus]MCH4430709.1 Hsp20/alpha crystallin family protein [Staphylococcus haemolyticus]MCH4505758.1 Hsp20/alpha crystallin family protein [Staphylococcus haemolyticus]MCK6068657.1 Hsp20/alpha crystallin family protein [Staphylococcus haemolyticus]MCK6110654.1 Hsp20/alpha crystallin family protein [Staphylococcus haemolyticus]
MNNREFFEQSIFKNNPKDVFRDLGEQVFNQFSSKSFPTNIYNQTNQYVLEAELPGVNKSEIELKFEHAALTIKVQKHVSEQTGSVQLSERASGELVRHFEFNDIDKSQIKASYEDGILVVILPKEVSAQDHSTTITVE